MINIEPLKAIDIKDVWQALGFELGRGNGNVRCFGTAHKNGDRNPSMGLNSRTNRFKCFACDLQGDSIELVMQVKNLDFTEATKWLSDAFNAPLSRLNEQYGKIYTDSRYSPYKAVTSVKLDPIRNPNFDYELPEYINIYKAFYDYTSEPDQKLLDFWHGRGLSDELLERANWRTITKNTWQAIAKEYSAQELLKAGLLSERGERLSPLFYNHNVLVPFFDFNGLIYFRARSLDPSVKAKYLAPKGTSPPIYNYQTLADYEGKDPLYITESETDALALNQMGYTALALVGGQKHPDSLTVRELTHAIIEGFSTSLEVAIVADRDDTGDNFYKAVAKALDLAGLRPSNISKVQSDPMYKDIADEVKAQLTQSRTVRTI